MVTPQFITSESKLPASYFSPLPVAEIYERHMKGTQDARPQFVLRAGEQPCVDVGNSLADRSSPEEAGSFEQEDDKLSCCAVRTEGAMHCTSGKSKELLQSQVLANETWGTQRVHTFTARMATYFCYW